MGRRRKTKTEIQAIKEKGPFKDITCENSLENYLSTNENSYNNFMLILIKRKKSGVLVLDEKHHIIPISEGGPNADWNLVPVTYAEHKEAHHKRFEVFGNSGDLVAALGRESLPENFALFKRERAKLGHETMKVKKIGFYSTELQRELGKRSGGVKTPAREIGYTDQISEKTQDILSKELVFKHETLGIVQTTPPNTFARVGLIKDFLVSLMPEGNVEREAICSDKYFTTNLNKVLKRVINPNASNSRNSYKGWSVTGL